MPHPHPQHHEGLAGLYPSCHLQGLVLISCCGSWGLGGRLQSRELKPVWDSTHSLDAGVSGGQGAGRKMGGHGTRRHKGMGSGRGKGEGWRESQPFQGSYSGQLCIYSEAGMQRSICQLSIYYKCIGLGPRTP